MKKPPESIPAASYFISYQSFYYEFGENGNETVTMDVPEAG
jgi:hypothetical protein|tara:strand:- start:306 stop:428 length:123 start_codon:yes stop_codon:yes gene_type:complete